MGLVAGVGVGVRAGVGVVSGVGVGAGVDAEGVGVAVGVEAADEADVGVGVGVRTGEGEGDASLPVHAATALNLLSVYPAVEGDVATLLRVPSPMRTVHALWPIQAVPTDSGMYAHSLLGSSENGSPPQLPPTLPTEAKKKHSIVPELHEREGSVPSFVPAGYCPCAHANVRLATVVPEGHMYES